MLDKPGQTSIRFGKQGSEKCFCCIPSSTFDAHMASLQNRFDSSSIVYTRRVEIKNQNGFVTQYFEIQMNNTICLHLVPTSLFGVVSRLSSLLTFVAFSESKLLSTISLAKDEVLSELIAFRALVFMADDTIEF